MLRGHLACLAVAVAPLLCGPLGAAEQAFQSGGGSPDAWALQHDDRVVLHLPSGSSQEVPMAHGGRLQGVTRADAGYLLSVTGPTGDGQEATLVLADGATVQAFPPLPGEAGTVQDRVRPLLDEGRMAGAAWLAGTDFRNLEVRAARWTDGQWGPPQVVARPASGSQMALAATTLPDGRWLLAWSRFDGSDDEIAWAVRSSTGWSSPQRLGADNTTPDVTPALVSLPDGSALLAWSRLIDGGYRVLVSRFAAGAWSPGELLPGAGAVDPRLLPLPGGAALLYASTEPRVWAVVELDAAGRPLRLAAVDRRDETSPRLDLSSGSTVTFIWEHPARTESASWQELR